MPRPALEVCHLTKKFPPSFFALRDISLSLSSGSFAILTGPNGSGKTTLLKTLAGLLAPDAGHIMRNGAAFNQGDIRTKHAIGFMPDHDRSLYWRLTGRQNLDFFASLYGLRAVKRRKRIETLLAQFSIGYADQRVDCYSSGMKRKFLLVRCLLHEPEFLFLDEPTKGLDAASAQAAIAFLSNLCTQNGVTILMSTHAPQEVMRASDTHVKLENGSLVSLSSCSNR
jgi:ABC-2 type transport system ATP-binding protein